MAELIQLSIRCKWCGERLSLPINSKEELIEVYGQLAGLYYDHLFYRHLDVDSVLEDGEILLERKG